MLVPVISKKAGDTRSVLFG